MPSAQTKLNEVDKLKFELDTLRPLPEETIRAIDLRIRLDWNYHSNAIEGNTLNYGETQALLIYDRYLGNHEGRFYREIRGHDDIIKNINELVKDKEYPLNQKLIRELHKSLLPEEYYVPAITSDGSPTKKKIVAGQYKSQPNSVLKSNGEMFYYADPLDVEPRMEKLIDEYNAKSGLIHPIELAAWFHYEFILIHPFDDGNGRLTRILMNLILLRHNYVPAIIRVEEKAKYLEVLGTVDATSDVNYLTEFIAEKVQAVIELELKAAKGQDITAEGDFDKMLSLLSEKLKIKIEAPRLKKTDTSINERFTAFIRPSINKLESHLSKLNIIARDIKLNVLYSTPDRIKDLNYEDFTALYEGQGDILETVKRYDINTIRVLITIGRFKNELYKDKIFIFNLDFNIEDYFIEVVASILNSETIEVSYEGPWDKMVIDLYLEKVAVKVLNEIMKLLEIK